jgi:6-phosphogluconolactonase (cycloisomerase 2 family)
MAAPGPVPARQDAPHLHNTVLDPSGKFILVPDLGADLVRVYAIQANSTSWKAQTPVKAVPGSGPRHGAFVVSGGSTFFYTLNEVGNSITGYNVTYSADWSMISLSQFFTFNSHGPNTTVPVGTKASEIQVSVSDYQADI